MSQSEKREYLLMQSIRDVMLEPFGVNSLEVKFRTRSENGILIHIQESSNYTTVKVRGEPMLTQLNALPALGQQQLLLPQLLSFSFLP